MKTKSPLKIILFVSLFFVVVFAGALFVASKKFKPEELKELVIVQLEKAIPNSKVTTKALDFSVGLKSSIDISGVDITLKGSKAYPLVSVENLQLKVPFWSLLFGGGKVELAVKGPKLHYIEFSKDSNWQRALKAKKQGVSLQKNNPKSNNAKKSEKAPVVKNEEIMIPAFLASSELNISILDLLVNYNLRDKTSGRVTVEKFLLKDVGIKSTTAFELKSKMDILKGTPEHTELEVLLIGESKLYQWIEDKQVNINSKLILSNIKNKSLRAEINKISLNKKINYKKTGEFNVSTKVLLEEKEILSAVINGQGEKIKVDNIDLKLGLLDAISLVMDKNQLPINLTGKEQLKVTGSINVGKVMTPDLKFEISPALKMKQKNINISSILRGQLSGKGVDFNVENELLSGHINLDGKIRTNWSPESFKKLRPIKLDVDVRDLKITPDLISTGTTDKSSEKAKTLDNKNSGKSSEAAKKTEPQGMTQIIPIPVQIMTNLENISLAGAKLSGNILFDASKSVAQLSTNNLKLDNGEIFIKDKISLSNGIMINNFDTRLTNINLSSLNGFVPKKTLEGLSGLATGKVTGALVGASYKANVDFSLKDGKLTKINLQEYVSGLIEKFGPLKKALGKKEIKVNGEFKSMSLKGSFDNNRHHITKFDFNAKDGVVMAKGKGSIYPTGQKKSVIDLSLILGGASLVKSLKKSVGTNIFPMKLEGTGYALMPDYNYTLKKVGKVAAKTQVKKQAQKQIKKLMKKDKVNKLLKNKKVDKLLKGLFK